MGKPLGLLAPLDTLGVFCPALVIYLALVLYIDSRFSTSETVNVTLLSNFWTVLFWTAGLSLFSIVKSD